MYILSLSLRSFSDSAEIARKLWEYLIKQEDIREMFIHNLFSDKVRVCVCVYVCVCRGALLLHVASFYWSRHVYTYMCVLHSDGHCHL